MAAHNTPRRSVLVTEASFLIIVGMMACLATASPISNTDIKPAHAQRRLLDADSETEASRRWIATSDTQPACDVCNWKCAAGYYRKKIYTAGDLDCSTSGYHTDTQADCVAAAGNKFAYPYNSTCVACPAGKTSPAGSAAVGDCTNCTAGKTSTAGGACVQCVAGKFAAAGDNSCSDCGAGKTSPAGSAAVGDCTDCTAGTASSGGGACVQCVAGKYAAAAAASCSDCGAGKSSPAGSAAVGDCANCTAGTASSGGEACVQCVAGKFAADAGSASCTACPGTNSGTGTAIGSTAQTACGCNAGFYGNATANDCQACTNGKYSLFTAGVTLVAVCTTCPAGKFGTGPIGSCTDCPEGTYSSRDGQTAITTCVPCLDRDGALPINSTSGTFTWGNHAPAGSIAASACKSTKTTCVNVPVYAEMMFDEYKTCTEAVSSCADNKVLSGSGATAKCEDCTGTCRMDMSFDVTLYMTKTEFTAKESAFITAVGTTLGISDTAETDITVKATESAAVHVLSKTTTVTTKVNLKAPKSKNGAGFLPSTLKTNLLSGGVTSDAVGIPDARFTDKGTVVAVGVPTYTKISGILTAESATDKVEVTLTFAAELTKTEQSKVRMAVAVTAGVPVDNVLMEKARRRASHGAVQYKITVFAADATAATTIAGKLTETALKQEIAVQGGPTPTAVGTATAGKTNSAAGNSTAALSAANRAAPMPVAIAFLVSSVVAAFSVVN